MCEHEPPERLADSFLVDLIPLKKPKIIEPNSSPLGRRLKKRQARSKNSLRKGRRASTRSPSMLDADRPSSPETIISINVITDSPHDSEDPTPINRHLTGNNGNESKMFNNAIIIDKRGVIEELEVEKSNNSSPKIRERISSKMAGMKISGISTPGNSVNRHTE